MIKSEIRNPKSETHGGEEIDLERMNFVEWYRAATLEDLEIARRNNAAKLQELKKKYAGDVAVIDAVRGAENN